MAVTETITPEEAELLKKLWDQSPAAMTTYPTTDNAGEVNGLVLVVRDEKVSKMLMKWVMESATAEQQNSMTPEA